MTAGSATASHGGTKADIRARVARWPRSAIFYGLVTATIAVIVGEWLHVSPPAAYGLCSACHGRDLTDWLVNNVEGKHLFITAAGAKGWPLLTVVGVVAGSFAAAKRNGEHATLNLGENGRMFVYGFIVMGAALFVGGCPTRILIRSGYGDLAGVLALAGVAAGIVGATVSMRWMARR